GWPAPDGQNAGHRPFRCGRKRGGEVAQGEADEPRGLGVGDAPDPAFDVGQLRRWLREPVPWAPPAFPEGQERGEIADHGTGDEIGNTGTEGRMFGLAVGWGRLKPVRRGDSV